MKRPINFTSKSSNGGEAVRHKAQGERGEDLSGGRVPNVLRTVIGTGHSNDRRVAFPPPHALLRPRIPSVVHDDKLPSTGGAHGRKRKAIPKTEFAQG